MNGELKILLGEHRKELVYWIPTKEINAHLVLTGGSGSGKTETLKAICLELKDKKIPIIIIDFHKDFEVLADNLIGIENARIHPLEIQIGEKPLDVIYRFAKIVTNVFPNFGSMQEALVREAIKRFYTKSGITDFKEINAGQFNIRPFLEFKHVLEDMRSAEGTDPKKVISKLSMLFDFDLFNKADKTALPFETMTTSVSVIQLHEFPNDEIKTMVAELIMYKLIHHCYKSGKQDNLKMYCVIDEAHRVIYDGSPIDLLFRESRKYGLGMILASQRPTDFSENILANIGAVIAFRCSLKKDAVYISNSIACDPDMLLQITKPGDGCCRFSTETSATSIHIIPLKERSKYNEVIRKFNEEDAKKAAYFELKRVELEEKEKKEAENAKKQAVILKSELQHKENFLKSLNEELQKTIQEKNVLENTLMSTREEVVQKHKDLVKATNLNSVLAEKLAESEDRIKHVLKENQTLNKSFTNLTDELETTKKYAAKLKKELNHLDEKNIELKSEVDLLRGNVKELTETKLLLCVKIKKIEEELTKDIKTKYFVKHIDFSTDFKKCPKCELINEGGGFCSECGSKLKK